MSSFTYQPHGVCSREISFDLEDGRLHNVKFIGGCAGNLAAISKLLEGADPKQTVEILKGNQCGARGTSCADQLTKAIEEALAQA
ncbi:MAG: TIGR03905 family TSCPD domain-containing protein [Eubacteriales bacterium]|nr:TIGR03905 family TSCPD domain-containing protein [Eubacteriales bacterium]